MHPSLMHPLVHVKLHDLMFVKDETRPKVLVIAKFGSQVYLPSYTATKQFCCCKMQMQNSFCEMFCTF